MFHPEIVTQIIDGRIISLVSLLKKRRQINFSHQNFSIENSYFCYISSTTMKKRKREREKKARN